jgi:hypothetical protein
MSFYCRPCRWTCSKGRSKEQQNGLYMYIQWSVFRKYCENGFGLWTCKCVHDIECYTQGLVNSSYCFWFVNHDDYSSNDSCWNGATFLFLLHGQVLFIGELQFGLTGKHLQVFYLISIGNISCVRNFVVKNLQKHKISETHMSSFDDSYFV